MTLGRVPLLTKRKDLLQKIQCASVLLLFLWTWNPDHRETTMKLIDFLYVFLETIKAPYFFIPVTEVSSLKSHANKLK